MTETLFPTPGGPCGAVDLSPVPGRPEASGSGEGRQSGAASPVGLPELDSRGLDSRGVLEGLVARRRVADRAEAELLALVVRFVDLHPPVDPDA
ncbi:MAG TPA: hypothetical protein VFQ11_06195, partial [Nocardioidaceae bacterium]|nr:hypothetical protein [Nocardioidaceae bacterium]